MLQINQQAIASINENLTHTHNLAVNLPDQQDEASLQDPDEALRERDLFDLFVAVTRHPRDPDLSEDEQIASLLSSISDEEYWARIVSRSAESHSTSAELLRDFMQDMEDEEGGQTPL